MSPPADTLPQTPEEAQDEETRTRRALLHMLEDLQQERDRVAQGRRQWVDTVDAIRDPLLVHDPTGRVVRANKAYAEAARLRFSQVIGRPYWQCFPRRSGPLTGWVDRGDGDGLAPAAGPPEEFTLPGGEVYSSRAFELPHDDAAGGPATLRLFENITQRRQAQQQQQARSRRRAAQAEALSLISASAALAGGDIDALAHELDEQVCAACGARRADVWLLDGGPGELHCIDHYDDTSGRHVRLETLLPEQFEGEFAVLRQTPGEAAGGAHSSGFATLRGDDEGPASILGAVIELAGRPLGLLRITHRDPRHLWEDDEIAFAGRVAGKIGIALANREARLADAARRESELRLRTIFEQAPVGISESSLEGRYLAVNQRLCEITGYSRAELLKLGFADITHPQDLGRDQIALARLLSGELPRYQTEKRYLRQDGSPIWVALMVTPVRDEAGRIRYLITIVEDINERKAATQALQDSRQQLAGLVASAMDAILTMDGRGRIVLSNPAAEALFGYRAAELATMPLTALMPERLRAAHSAGITALLDGEPQARLPGGFVHFMGLRRSGEEFPIEASISSHEAGGQPFFTAILRDITERVRSDEQIRRLNRVHAVLSGINGLIVRVHQRDELFNGACRLAVEVGGIPMAWIGILDAAGGRLRPTARFGMAENLYLALQDLLATPERAAATMAMQAVEQRQTRLSNDLQHDPQVLLRADYAEQGIRSMAYLPLLVAGRAVGVLALYAAEAEYFHAEELKLLTQLADDVALAIDHIDKAERLDFLAYYDPLTGLANRSLFIERVGQSLRSIARGRGRLALLLIDLERFSNINDSLGRPAGDALLKQMAQWLTERFGDHGLLARVGSDHFAVMLPELPLGGELSHLLADTTGALLGHDFLLGGTAMRVAAKFGVALYPDDGSDADTLYRNAEAALKKAKASGERYLFYTQKMTAAVAEKLALETRLRKALEQREFVLHFQPKVGLARGELTGAEALIRWHDPQGGLVPPLQFIPLLEETGLIREVGAWAIDEAIACRRRWREAGWAAPVIAVNVSSLQLRNRDLAEQIRRAIAADAQAAAGIELEITESLIMDDVRHGIALLQEIRELGVPIAIDDFGTGFSSLSYLARLPVDTLKIDRSFVVDIDSGPQGLALVSAIVTLAHSLGLKVVAEGVDSESQRRALRELGCDQMQGYLFSPPLPAGEFEQRFLNNVG